MSLETGNIISAVQSKYGSALYSAPEIATCLAFICGFVVLGIGLLRIGWLVEFSESLLPRYIARMQADRNSPATCCVRIYDR